MYLFSTFGVQRGLFFRVFGVGGRVSYPPSLVGLGVLGFFVVEASILVIAILRRGTFQGGSRFCGTRTFVGVSYEYINFCGDIGLRGFRAMFFDALGTVQRGRSTGAFSP